MALVRVASINDIPEGSGKVVSAEGKDIALFKVSGKFYALDNTCKHRGGPIGEGSVDGQTVTCPWHGWMYDILTGQCQNNPTVGLQKYNVVVEGNDVKIEV